MRDRDKPIVMYRRGPANFIIVPRGRQGWSQFVVWLGLLGALVAWLVDQSVLDPGNEQSFEVIALFAIGVFIWLVAGLWWMIARAKIVEVAELMRDRQRERRKRRRGQ